MKEQLVLFSAQHLVPLKIIFLINSFIFFYRKQLRKKKAAFFLRLLIAVFLLLQEISLQIWYISTGTWSWSTSLPLNLCSVSVILSCLMLTTKKYFLYEIVYFWGIGGAFQALLTPDMGHFNFPHFRYFQFFISHGLIITAVIVMTCVYSFRPNNKSIIKVFGITNIFAAFAAVVNVLTGGNYLYLCHKPSGPSLMDFLGPWPWYIISLEAAALIIFLISYLPFLISDILNKRKDSPSQSPPA